MSFRKLRIVLVRLGYIPIAFVGLFVWRSWTAESVRDFAIEWTGYALLMMGVGIRLWSILYIGKRKGEKLVTTGPYSLCRNPLYVGTLFIAAGAALCMENIAMLILTLGLMVPIHLLTVRGEERRLAERFGREYEQYRRRTPRYLPAFRRYQGPAEITVSVWAVRRATIETLAVMLIPPLGDLVEILHARGVLPVLWTPF